MTQMPSRAEAADDLREHAASCRRLARSSSTVGGSVALRTVAHQYEADAERIDPSSPVSVGAGSSGDWDALVRVRLALKRQMAFSYPHNGVKG